MAGKLIGDVGVFRDLHLNQKSRRALTELLETWGEYGATLMLLARTSQEVTKLCCPSNSSPSSSHDHHALGQFKVEKLLEGVLRRWPQISWGSLLISAWSSQLCDSWFRLGSWHKQIGKESELWEAVNSLLGEERSALTWNKKITGETVRLELVKRRYLLVCAKQFELCTAREHADLEKKKYLVARQTQGIKSQCGGMA